MTMEAADEETARRAGTAAFVVIAGLDQRLSDYRDDSDLRTIERAAPAAVRVVPEVFAVVKQAMEVAKASDGAFDPTVAPLVALWRLSRASRVLPTAAELAAARALVGWSRVELDDAAMTVRLPEPGMRLDLGGIAKGYILQRAGESLRSAGIASALIEAGGDMTFFGARAWKAQVGAGCSVLGAVHGVLVLGARQDGALSTSGATAQFVEIGGVRYSHVVDPRTGLGLTDHRTVHVRAPDGATSDAWATALGVLGPERAKQVVVPEGVSFCFVT